MGNEGAWVGLRALLLMTGVLSSCASQSALDFAAGESWKKAVAERFRTEMLKHQDTVRGRTVVVKAVVDPSGDLASAAIMQSSGSQGVDAAALRVVRQAAPLPQPPRHALGRRGYMTAVIPIAFGR